ncbi:hypothetical protein [Richelia intracellularis]|uniref:hypothetical protein n=1 Tax=Richelia intracellularis TaxID=1164990 RepID=UPI0012DF4356|nr:hypothetical protein [Richelia intracellularis]
MSIAFDARWEQQRFLSISVVPLFITGIGMNCTATIQNNLQVVSHGEGLETYGIFPY